MMRFCSRSLFLDFCPCGDIHEKRVRKRRKITFFEENRLYLLNGWLFLPGSAGHFCRTPLCTLDKGRLSSLTFFGIDHLAFPYDHVCQFWALLAIFGYISLRRIRYSAPFVQNKVVVHVMLRLQSYLKGFSVKWLWRKIVFFWTKAQKRRFYLNFLVKIFNLTITEGNPWPFYVPTHPFGIVAHFFGWDDTFKVSFILISMLYFYNDRTVLDTVRK